MIPRLLRRKPEQNYAVSRNDVGEWTKWVEVNLYTINDHYIESFPVALEPL